MQQPIIKQMHRLPVMIAGDRCRLREIFHPNNDAIDVKCSLAHAYLEKGQRTISHSLEQAEIYYILSGTGVMHINEMSFEVSAGVAFYVPPHSTQWLDNTTDGKIEFLVVVDPAWSAEQEVVNE